MKREPVAVSQRILELEERMNDPSSDRCWPAIRVFNLLAEHNFQRAVALLEADGHGRHELACIGCDFLSGLDDEMDSLDPPQ